LPGVAERTAFPLPARFTGPQNDPMERRYQTVGGVARGTLTADQIELGKFFQDR
jgi:hypothetical protein